jgi:hypothetical protein
MGKRRERERGKRITKAKSQRRNWKRRRKKKKK